MTETRHIAVLTSGGDAQGMNAAVRAVVRTGIARGLRVSAVYEGYQGLVEGGDRIREMSWSSVAGILQLGGTIIGTARSNDFRQREGRLRVVENLVGSGIDGIVVIGGDGSLTGADLLRREWPELVGELLEAGRIEPGRAARHPELRVVGLVGSIDNDMLGTDMTIGADSALHRITEAIDAITATAASHQRTFVVEVMGRHCGYLGLYSALAGGADWVIIPEAPPGPGWEDEMADTLAAGRASGRRDSIVVVAEGARDAEGSPIDATRVRIALEDRLGVDCRVTVLGHVQRGGSPSVFDRYMSTILGNAAVLELDEAPPGTEPQLIGLKNGKVTKTPLVQAVAATREIADALAAGDHDRAISMRGGSFRSTLEVTKTLMQVFPSPHPEVAESKRLAILHAGGPAPGMNTAARVVARLVIDAGHRAVGVRNGFDGLVTGDVVELDWMAVSGWATKGGAELGVARRDLSGKDLYAIAKTIERHEIDGIVMIGGWSGYRAVHRLCEERANFPSFDIPMVCVPATIDNNLPGTTTSIGSDTALNSISGAIDRIKQSAVASGRCFVVEVMGRRCGYLALMTGLASGAERVFLAEDGVTLDDLRTELDSMVAGFRAGKRLNLVVRNELANDVYSTAFMSALFEEEGGDLFEVRQAVLGHLQQGGDPSPYDRIYASRLAGRTVTWWLDQIAHQRGDAAFIGVVEGAVRFTSFDDFVRLVDLGNERPREQWWTGLRDLASTLSHGPGPHGPGSGQP
jgi:6-phosphofructokinase 1